jgi:hypothetical protein
LRSKNRSKHVKVDQRRVTRVHKSADNVRRSSFERSRRVEETLLDAEEGSVEVETEEGRVVLVVTVRTDGRVEDDVEQGVTFPYDSVEVDVEEGSGATLPTLAVTAATTPTDDRVEVQGEKCRRRSWRPRVKLLASGADSRLRNDIDEVVSFSNGGVEGDVEERGGGVAVVVDGTDGGVQGEIDDGEVIVVEGLGDDEGGGEGGGSE